MADGSIVIDTKINTDGIEEGANDLKTSLNKIISILESMSKTVEGIFSQFSSGATAATKDTQNLRKEIEETAKAQEEWKPQDMSTLKIDRGETANSDYDGPLHEPVQISSDTSRTAKEIAAEMEESAKNTNEFKRELEAAKAILKELEGQGQWFGDADYDKAYQNLKKIEQAASDYKKELTSPTPAANPFGLDTLAGKLREAELELEHLKNAGKGLGDADYDKAYQKLVGLTAEAKEYKKNLAVNAVLNGNSKKLDEQNKKLSIAQNLVNKLKSAFSGIGRTLSSGAVKNSGKSMSEGFGRALKTLLKYSLGIRSLFVLMNKLRSAIVDGFKNLAQYSAGTNSSISMLMSALTQLKNSLATAFNPILTVVAPILTTLINLLSKAATYVGMFFAALTGQKTFTKAAAVQEDYAKSLQKTSRNTKQAAKDTKKANKETDGYLSTLDEVTRFSSNKNDNSGNDTGTSPVTSGGYKAPSPSEMFQTVPVESAFTNLAKKLKKIFSEIFKPFKQAWAKEGTNTIKAAKYALGSLGTLAQDVGKSLMSVWTNGTGTKMLTTILQIAQNVLKTIGNIATQLDAAWNKNEVGTKIIQAIANAFQVVLDFVNRIAADTATWAANLNFYPLLESIKNLFESLSPLLTAIGNFLEWMYTNVILPMLKWVIETGMPALINAASKLFKFLGDHQGIVDAIGAALVGAFAAAKIVPLIMKIMTAIKGLIALFTGSGGLLGGITAIATALGPAGIFAIAVGAAIAVGVLLYKNWDTICKWATKLKDWVIGKTRGLVDGVTKKLTNLKEKISGVWKYVSEKTTTTFKNMWNTVTTKVGAIRDAIVSKFANARDTVVDTFTKIRDTVASVFNGVIGIVNGAIGTINGAISTVESAFSFGPWKVPTPFGSKTIGFKATFPRVPTVPYLAKGAVIPPRSEFLAVLGDQKQGNNIETPEALLRKIVREETAGRQAGGGNYRFTAQINRRTLFDEMMKEAQMRRDTSGRNPFEMA